MNATEKQVGMLSGTVMDYFSDVLVDKIENGSNMKYVYLEEWAKQQDSYDTSALITILRDEVLTQEFRTGFLKQYLNQKGYKN